MHLRSFIAACTLVVFSVLPNGVSASSTVPVALANQDDFVRAKMREHLGYHPLLEVVAGCESTGQPHDIRHWETDGSLVKNPKSSASGALQVLRKLHAKWIAREGLDLRNIDDYMEFVKILFSTQGYRAWDTSKSCWGRFARYLRH